MLLNQFENLKKSMEVAQWNPELQADLIEELRFFFRMLRIKLESGDPKMRASAAEEIKELKEYLKKHPAILALASLSK